MGQLHPKTSQDPPKNLPSTSSALYIFVICVFSYILLLEPPSPSECEDIAMGQKNGFGLRASEAIFIGGY